MQICKYCIYILVQTMFQSISYICDKMFQPLCFVLKHSRFQGLVLSLPNVADLWTFKISLGLTIAFNLNDNISFIKFGFNPFMGLKMCLFICCKTKLKKKFFFEKIFVFYKTYIICRKKCFNVEKRFYIEKCFTEKNFFYKEK